MNAHQKDFQRVFHVTAEQEYKNRPITGPAPSGWKVIAGGLFSAGAALVFLQGLFSLGEAIGQWFAQ